jgi:hypothetical protein
LVDRPADLQPWQFNRGRRQGHSWATPGRR